MKVKQFLIELRKYNRDKKEVTSEREVILIKCKESQPMSTVDIFLLVNSMYIDAIVEWDMTHEILTIGDGAYKTSSGNIEFTDERFKLLTSAKGVLVEINMTNHDIYKFYYNDNGASGEEYIRIPRNVGVVPVLAYYKQKFPKKNYSLDKKTIKKELSERSQKLGKLPKKGETPSRDLRKVCYKKKDGEKIFRGQFNEVNKLVDSGDYEFAPKLAWKRQGEAYKSNITLPPDRGKKLGMRKEKRDKRDDLKRQKVIRSLQSRYNRQGQRKPGYAERKLQSEKDKKQFVERQKAKRKEVRPNPISRAFEAVILGDNSEILGTITVKAKSSGHAENILKTIMKNKSKEVKLTGKVSQWIKQTSANRVSST